MKALYEKICKRNITTCFTIFTSRKKMTEPDLKDSETAPQSKIVLEVDAFPFKGLEISEDWKKLEFLEGRTVCSSCKKSRKYFCYTCYVAVPEVQDIVPKVKLPLRVDIIKHAREMDGKSTAVHAAVLASEDVRIFTYPCIPNYSPDENVVLIYPNKNAVSVDDIYKHFLGKACDESRCKKPRLEQDRPAHVIHRAVFVDSTWNQSRGILKDERLKILPTIVLKTRLSQFWRHQADSPRWYLATIEAIHQFLVELDAAQRKYNQSSNESVTIRPDEGTSTEDEKCSTSEETSIEGIAYDSVQNSSEHKNDDSETSERVKFDGAKQGSKEECSNSGQYDNLLFFFRFMYSKIHKIYDHDQLRSYKRRLE